MTRPTFSVCSTLASISIAVATLGVCAPAAAREIEVGTDFPTIQAAIDGAQDGDVVRVPPKTFHESIHWRTKRITLVGERGEGDARTILEPAESTGRPLEMIDVPEGGRVENLSIRNGRADEGGGLRISGGAPTLANVDFVDNSAKKQGGAVMVDLAEVTFSGCVFRSSLPAIAASGGAVFVTPRSRVRMMGCSVGIWINRGGVAISAGQASTLEVSECTFENNLGAIEVHEGDARIKNSVFRNTAARMPAVRAEGARIELRGCTFENNLPIREHRYALAGKDSEVSVTSSIFADNDGAMLLDTCRSTIAGSTIRGSQSTAVEIRGGKTSIQGSTFTANAGARFGGAIAVKGGEVDISASVFRGNTALRESGGAGGGALYVGTDATVRVTNTVFFGNRATDLGGAILVGGGSLNVLHASFARNAAKSGGALGVESGGAFQVTNSILWQDTGGELGGVGAIGSSRFVRYTVHHSDVQGGAGTHGEGNIDADPLFVDLEHGDLHLRAGSPCIDAGTVHIALPATDLDGRPRVHGAGPDMGAYEHQGS